MCKSPSLVPFAIAYDVMLMDLYIVSFRLWLGMLTEHSHVYIYIHLPTLSSSGCYGSYETNVYSCHAVCIIYKIPVNSLDCHNSSQVLLAV